MSYTTLVHATHDHVDGDVPEGAADGLGIWVGSHRQREDRVDLEIQLRWVIHSHSTRATCHAEGKAGGIGWRRRVLRHQDVRQRLVDIGWLSAHVAHKGEVDAVLGQRHVERDRRWRLALADEESLVVLARRILARPAGVADHVIARLAHVVDVHALVDVPAKQESEGARGARGEGVESWVKKPHGTLTGIEAHEATRCSQGRRRWRRAMRPEA